MTEPRRKQLEDRGAKDYSVAKLLLAAHTLLKVGLSTSKKRHREAHGP